MGTIDISVEEITFPGLERAGCSLERTGCAVVPAPGGFIVTGGFGPAHDVGEGEHELAIDTIRFWLLRDHER